MGEYRNKMSLAEYAAANPTEQPESERREQAAHARSYTERKEAEAKGAELMAQILRQLENGTAPQTVLYTAVETIGIITGADEWKAAAEKSLASIYADLAQQSFLVDNESIAAERLQARAEEQAAKTRRQLANNLRKCKQLETALQEALNAAQRLFPEDMEQTPAGHAEDI